MKVKEKAFKTTYYLSLTVLNGFYIYKYIEYFAPDYSSWKAILAGMGIYTFALWLLYELFLVVYSKVVD